MNARIRYGIALAFALSACSAETKEAPAMDDAGDSREPATQATGKVIDVKMITDDKGNYYEPAAIHAETGDVVRFTIVTGVHNVNFLPDSNAGKQGLPAPSDLLQLPGQTLDVPVTFAEGSYYFQCDPHALLGMMGRLHVASDDDNDDSE